MYFDYMVQTGAFIHKCFFFVRNVFEGKWCVCVFRHVYVVLGQEMSVCLQLLAPSRDGRGLRSVLYKTGSAFLPLETLRDSIVFIIIYAFYFIISNDANNNKKKH